MVATLLGAASTTVYVIFLVDLVARFVIHIPRLGEISR